MKTIKIISLCVILCMILSVFAACGNVNGDTTASAGNTESEGSVAENPENDDDASEVRNTVVLSTENFELKVPEMTYYFHSAYQNASYYAAYVEFEFDPTQPLKDQVCSLDPNGGTWYDYFVESAKYTGTELLSVCEAARAAGVELDDDDRAMITEQLAMIEGDAASEEVSVDEYLAGIFGPNVRESDILHLWELSTLANKYLQNSIKDADVSDSALEAYYENNRSDFDVVSYLSYTFYYKDVGIDDEKESRAQIALYGNELTKCKDEASFREYVRNYASEVLGLEGDAAEAELKDIEHIDEARSAAEESGQRQWLFENAEAGDTHLAESDNGKRVTVVLVTKAATRDETCLKNVRHILFLNTTYDDDSKAREVYDKWVADGASLDDFLALVKEYSEDPGSMNAGGLYEDVPRGKMVEPFEDWIYDETREVGDHGIVETSYGWHIMYFVGDSFIWKKTAQNAIQGQAYDEVHSAALEAYPVTVNEEGLEMLWDE